MHGRGPGFNEECALRLKAEVQRLEGRGLEAALTGTESVKMVLENRAGEGTAAPGVF